jgi:hypothetical protein
MRAEIERQFKDLLENHDREFLVSAAKSAANALREQDFEERFHERAKDIIEPAMVELSQLLHDHEIKSGFVVTNRHTDMGGKVTPSSIAFEFRVLTDPETHGFPITTPTLSFIADPANMDVQVHENSILPFLGGHIGMIDRFKLGDLTEERVEKHLLAVAKKVLRGTGAA